ncbi:hypothetical protein VTK56DRAFT_7604 [Thermocarpiscus australiensis]
MSCESPSMMSSPEGCRSPVSDWQMRLTEALDKAFRDETATFTPAHLPAWSVPLPLAIDVTTHVFQDAERVKSHCRGIEISYDDETHSVKPTMPSDYAETDGMCVLWAYCDFCHTHTRLIKWVEYMALVLKEKTRLVYPQLNNWSLPNGDNYVREAELHPTAAVMDPGAVQERLMRYHTAKFRAMVSEEKDQEDAFKTLAADADQRLEHLRPHVGEAQYEEAVTQFSVMIHEALFEGRIKRYDPDNPVRAWVKAVASKWQDLDDYAPEPKSHFDYFMEVFRSERG